MILYLIKKRFGIRILRWELISALSDNSETVEHRETK
jgi:hypothetical protein